MKVKINNRIIRTSVIMVLALAVFAGATIQAVQSLSPQAITTSSTYQLTASAFASAAIHTNSAAYEIYAGIQDNSAIRLSSPSYSMGGGFAYAVYYVFGLAVLSITPPSGYNIAPITIDRITGLRFPSNATAYLRMSGEADIPATSVTVLSPSEITCEFNLAGARTGFWDLVVTAEGNAGGTLPAAFEVKSYSYDASVAINSPNPFDPARETTAVMYRLERDMDVNAYIFTTTGDLIWKNSFTAGFPGGKAGENSFLWNGISGFNEMLSNAVYLVHIVDKTSGRTVAKGKIMILRR